MTTTSAMAAIGTAIGTASDIEIGIEIAHVAPADDSKWTTSDPAGSESGVNRPSQARSDQWASLPVRRRSSMR